MRARLAVLAVAGLLAVLGVTAITASGAGHETEVRITAQRLADGRTEFALQQREADDGWSERLLPSLRFFPAGADVGRWLSSTPLTVRPPGAGDDAAGAEVRITAQRLADGRTEFALQQRERDGQWSERLLPSSRFFPAAADIGRWLSSTPLTVRPPGAGDDAAGAEVRITAQRLADGRTEFALQQREPDGQWSERLLPSSRFFPAAADIGRWLSSTPLTVRPPGAGDDAAGAEVRITAQRLADGRTEFALQQREPDGQWSERLLPSSRFFPAAADVGRWLSSTPLTVRPPRPFSSVSVAAVPPPPAAATPEVAPTATPEVAPTATPEVAPTATPEVAPTATPEVAPTATPEVAPTATPDDAPTATPDDAPTATPEVAPTATPDVVPTATPDDGPTVEQESRLAVILPSPRTIVFREVGESARLEVRGLYSDGAERTLPDQSGSTVAFRSSDPAVAEVDADGLITSVAPGGVDISVEYGGLSADVPIIVYAPVVEVPPYDPQRVVTLDSGTEFVVNRVIVRPVGDVYDSELAHEIAAAQGADIFAEWRNLGTFGLELDIDTIDELEAVLLRLDADSRVRALQIDLLYTVADYHDLRTSAGQLAQLPKAWQLIEDLGVVLAPTHIAVLDADLSLRSADSAVQAMIEAEFDLTRVSVINDAPDLAADAGVDRLGSHGLAVTSVIAGTGMPGVVAGISNVPYVIHLYHAGHGRQFERAEVESFFESMVPHKQYVSVVNISASKSCDTDSWVDLFSHPLCGKLVHPEFGGGGSERFADMPDTVFVVSAGNFAEDVTGEYPFTPAAWSNGLDNIITVGALNQHASPQDDQSSFSPVDRACFSNYGDAITVAAEGARVYTLSTQSNTGYKLSAGTSFSAPLVSGIAALIHAVDETLTPADIRDILISTATKVVVDSKSRPDCGDAPQSTWNQVNARAAIDKTIAMAINAEFSERYFAPESVEFGDEYRYSVDIDNIGRIPWTFYVYSTVTSPSGRVYDSLPLEVTVAAGISSPVTVRFAADEVGDWTIATIVSGTEIEDRQTIKASCVDNGGFEDCLEIKIPVNKRASDHIETWDGALP